MVRTRSLRTILSLLQMSEGDNGYYYSAVGSHSKTDPLTDPIQDFAASDSEAVFDRQRSSEVLQFEASCWQSLSNLDCLRFALPETSWNQCVRVYYRGGGVVSFSVTRQFLREP
jgi:hypothetical protein